MKLTKYKAYSKSGKYIIEGEENISPQKIAKYIENSKVTITVGSSKENMTILNWGDIRFVEIIETDFEVKPN